MRLGVPRSDASLYRVCRLALVVRWQLWNLDDGVPLTPRVASAATFEHLITDDFRADTPAVLPEPWGYAGGEDGYELEGAPAWASSDCLDCVATPPNREDEYE